MEAPGYIEVIVYDPTKKGIIIKTKVGRGGDFYVGLGLQDHHKYLIAVLKDDKGHKVDIEIKILRGSDLKFTLNSNIKDFRVLLPKNCPMDQKCFVIKNKVICPATEEDMREW